MHQGVVDTAYKYASTWAYCMVSYELRVPRWSHILQGPEFLQLHTCSQSKTIKGKVRRIQNHPPSPSPLPLHKEWNNTWPGQAVGQQPLPEQVGNRQLVQNHQTVNVSIPKWDAVNHSPNLSPLPQLYILERNGRKPLPRAKIARARVHHFHGSTF